MEHPLRTIHRERKRAIHVEEGAGTFGKADASDVPRLYVEVRNEKDEVVYRTWQSGPIEDWRRVTLYFDRVALDARGNEIGASFWEIRS